MRAKNEVEVLAKMLALPAERFKKAGFIGLFQGEQRLGLTQTF